MRTLCFISTALVCTVAAACGGDDDGTSLDGGGLPDAARRDAPAPPTDARTPTDAPPPPTDAPPPPTDAGPSGCAMGTETPIGQLCVTEATATSATFLVYPRGCFSSSCTIRHTTTCSVSRTGSALTLDALFCLEDTGGPVCTDDCNGGGFANCDVALEPGTYTATLGGLRVTFDAPSTLPFGGTCDGSMF